MVQGERGMTYVIRIERCEGFPQHDHTCAGRFIRAYDVDAHGGRGSVEFTTDPREAIRFASASLAMEAWRTQSKRVPLRDDGKPNRPLTAYTVEIEQV